MDDTHILVNGKGKRALGRKIGHQDLRITVNYLILNKALYKKGTQQLT